MTTVDSLRQSDTVVFDRDCEGTQIPYGNTITVPKGTQAYVGQTLGGNVTLQVPSFGLVQVMNKDVGALLKDGVLVEHVGRLAVQMHLAVWNRDALNIALPPNNCG